MRSTTALLTALSLGAFATACSGSDAPQGPWVEVYRSDEAVASVDTSRMTSRGSVDEVWARFDYAEADPVPGEPGEMISRVDMLERVDCTAGRVEDLVMEIRDSTGAMLGRDTLPTRWSTFGEHPFGETFFPALCRRLPDLRRR